MRFGRRDDFLISRHAWTVWGNIYPTTEVFREQGFDVVLDPSYRMDMLGDSAWACPNDVQLVFCRAAYTDDTYMCWVHDGFIVRDGYTYLSGALPDDEHGEPWTWNQTALVWGEIDVE